MLAVLGSSTEIFLVRSGKYFRLLNVLPGAVLCGGVERYLGLSFPLQSVLQLGNHTRKSPTVTQDATPHLKGACGRRSGPPLVFLTHRLTC